MDPRQAEGRFLEGVAVLEDKMPAAGEKCDFCRWAQIVRTIS
jgi:hypothetical protein